MAAGPATIEHSCDVCHVQSEFIHCIASTVASKLLSALPAVSADKDLLVHVVDELLVFEQVL